MITNFSGSFKDRDFDKKSKAELEEFFNIDFINQDPDEVQLYFQNLNQLAYQTVGVAHCMIHNQAAHNTIRLAHNYTNLDCYKRTYSNHIGAFSFIKSEDIVLDGTRIIGSRRWISQLHVADFVILRIRDTQDQKRWVFIDLEKAPQKITHIRNQIIGMRAARAGDIEIDIDLPPEWILDRHVPAEQLHRVLSFHTYGLITNYAANARALLDLGIETAKNQNFEVDYNIKNLDLQVRMLESLQFTNINSAIGIIDERERQIQKTQYEFSKKTLIDIIHFFLQISNSSMFDPDSMETQPLRDALVFSSHIANLYKNLTWGNMTF